MTNKTFGHSVGRALGYSAAAVVHGAVSTAQYTGRFGADVASGASESYAENAARFAAMRAARIAEGKALNIQAIASGPIVAAPKAKAKAAA